jgi:hypothetical protein
VTAATPVDSRRLSARQLRARPLHDSGRSAPAAEFPVEDLDVKLLAGAGSGVLQKGINNVSSWRVQREGDSHLSRLVRGEQVTMNDEALRRQGQDVGWHPGGCLFALLGPEVRNH